jgi:hypothetical protein
VVKDDWDFEGVHCRQIWPRVAGCAIPASRNSQPRVDFRPDPKRRNRGASAERRPNPRAAPRGRVGQTVRAVVEPEWGALPINGLMRR